MEVIPIMLAAVAVMFLVEKLWPANAQPKVQCWWPRVILTNLCQASIVWIIGLSLDTWMDRFAHAQPWGLRHHMGMLPQVLIGYLVITFAYYWWHRLRHESRFFWRLCHQLHHSPQRMEVLMSFYKHPLEITINAVFSSAITYVMLGCSVGSAATVTLITGVAELFYHWNIKTPLWLGPIFQRPESHRVHHQRKHHTNNYSDIPLWDILFGTYQNPRSPVPLCGFDPEKENRFDDMLGFRDVHADGASQLAPMHLLPTCLGCSKRWACEMANSPCKQTPKENNQHENGQQ